MITIHCGLHKTGSSAIQSALGMVTHRRDLFVTSPRIYDGGFDPAWASLVRREGQRRHVLVTSESLLGDPFLGYDDAADRALALHEALGSEGVSVVLYLRPQVEWIPSIYLQEIQQGGTTEPSSFWASLKGRRNLRWANLVDSLGQVFSGERLVVRPYVSGIDVVQDFFRTTGLGRAPAVSGGAIRENVSISSAQAAIMRALNEDSSLTRAQRTNIRTFFQLVVRSKAGSAHSPFPRDVQVEISAEYEGDWRDVAELLAEYGGGEDFMNAMPQANTTLRDYAPPLPSDDPSVAELLRVVREMALRGDLDSDQSPWQRAVSKAQSNPRDIPYAIVRWLQRYGR